MRRFDYELPIEIDLRAKACLACGGKMRELQVGTRLTVHLPDDVEPEIFWTAAPLDAWTCTECGKTDLYARHPEAFRE